WGLPCRPCHQERGALLPHPFTLACDRRAGPSAVYSLLHFPSPCDARALPGTLPCGARTFLDTLADAAILTRLPTPALSDPARGSGASTAPPIRTTIHHSKKSRPLPRAQCPGEDSNLHAVSGTRSLVWPVYQFQHLGSAEPTSTDEPTPTLQECSREDSNLHGLAPTRS